MADLPETQYAVQLVGPDELVLNKSKEVFRPGPHQILCRVEVVGLCFSDLKLLKQFSSHVRKSELVAGIDPEILKEIPSYVPGQKPTVPGHETVIRIEAVGLGVKDFKPGERFLVQTDYRWLRTASSNGAFGYNFEGALQEYVLMDERVITSPDGESMLIPVSDELSASAIALVEPWACVEDAFVSGERTKLKADGQMLVVAEEKVDEAAFENLLNRYGKPAQITWLSKTAPVELDVPVKAVANISELTDVGYDDVLYFGSDAKTVESLFAKVAIGGLLNIVLCGGKFGRDVVTAVGRIHYGRIRITGTTGSDPADSMEVIPQTDEIREGDKINVIGAGGPMGMMHVIRNICQGVKGVSVFAGDLDDTRLETLTKIAAPLAQKNAVEYKTYNPTKEEVAESFDYTILMAPVPKLVAISVHSAAQRGLINIFAGIPATVSGEIDLDTYIEKQLYFIGTSGSTLDDMKRMLRKAESGTLDTNVSVAAICGLEGATEGIRAVEDRSIAGKIVVYPACREMGLMSLEELSEKMPQVAGCLSNGLWTKEAEDKLLEIYQNS
ncbi:MAG: alcohol dehydrogenase catalytic domain-containing protein [Phycisphaerae bacterium]|nr:alcohol dehydrogenase catalytic domain-containing protein [Phycisphaerae bacterium]NIS50991.1 alcohol dehydrogenase catalytic domain-containing protein [Phycisphaerae bacterium]NIU08641.1 alcohol dehydrogenase catalytic domain-containing protein [Phycisphaerae bacterium]NIU56224.1 alcohol dehydrogenase catalytic domain-containing protein [Phycisphaerae bacterium]NIV02339.1 alcohol dehydrogenase catalytic domain-containing protein [Phycisphaerae bacterium]